MTAKASKKAVEVPEGPRPPAAFGDALMLEVPIRQGEAICAAHGLVPEGRVKEGRAAHRLAWQVAVLGGAPADWRAEVLQVAYRKAAATGRLEAAKARGLPDLAENLEAQRAADDARAAELQELLAAAGPEADDNQKTRASALALARKRLAQTTEEVARYAREHLPLPDDLAVRHVGAQEAAVASEEAFETGAGKLQALSDEMEQARSRARHALGTTIINCIVEDAARVEAAILERFALFAEFPRQIPDDVLRVHTSALVGAAVAERLGNPHGARAYWGRLGEDAGGVLSVATGAGIGDDWLQRAQRRPGAKMLEREIGLGAL